MEARLTAIAAADQPDTAEGRAASREHLSAVLQGTCRDRRHPRRPGGRHRRPHRQGDRGAGRARGAGGPVGPFGRGGFAQGGRARARPPPAAWSCPQRGRPPDPARPIARAPGASMSSRRRSRTTTSASSVASIPSTPSDPWTRRCRSATTRTRSGTGRCGPTKAECRPGASLTWRCGSTPVTWTGCARS